MGKKKKVLIAEDEEPIRVALGQVLTEQGITALEAPDGQTALDLALEEHPDLIVLDILMPRMHGMDVYANIRKDDWGKDVKIIILTNYSTDAKVEEAARHDQTELLVKSDSKLDDFVEYVKKRLAES